MIQAKVGNRPGEGPKGTWGLWSTEKPGQKVGAAGIFRLRGFNPTEFIWNEANPVGTEPVVLAVVQTLQGTGREGWAVTSTGSRVQWFCKKQINNKLLIKQIPINNKLLIKQTNPANQGQILFFHEALMERPRSRSTWEYSKGNSEEATKTSWRLEIHLVPWSWQNLMGSASQEPWVVLGWLGGHSPIRGSSSALLQLLTKFSSKIITFY